MTAIFAFTFEAVAISMLSCFALRETLIVALPDRIAGPGGSFIDTDR